MKGMKQVNIMISPSGNDARSMQHARNTKNRRSCQQKVVMESWTKFTHYHFWTGSRKIQRQPSKCPISLLLSSSMYFIAAKKRLMFFLSDLMRGELVSHQRFLNWWVWFPAVLYLYHGKKLSPAAYSLQSSNFHNPYKKGRGSSGLVDPGLFACNITCRGKLCHCSLAAQA